MLTVGSVVIRVADLERLESLGARRVHWPKQPPGSHFVIMEDPEGLRFCVIDAAPEEAA